MVWEQDVQREKHRAGLDRVLTREVVQLASTTVGPQVYVGLGRMGKDDIFGLSCRLTDASGL